MTAEKETHKLMQELWKCRGSNVIRRAPDYYSQNIYWEYDAARKRVMPVSYKLLGIGASHGQ